MKLKLCIYERTNQKNEKNNKKRKATNKLFDVITYKNKFVTTNYYKQKLKRLFQNYYDINDLIRDDLVEKVGE